MKLAGNPKAFLSNEAKQLLDLYKSLGERAEIFLPRHIFDNLTNFANLCMDEPDDPAKQQAEINKYLLKFREDIPGYVDVSLMLIPHNNSKAFELSAKRGEFVKKIDSLLDTDGVDSHDSDDKVTIARSKVPELQYGFALQFQYKNWSIGTLFNGAARVNFLYGGGGFHPYNGGETGNVLSIVKDPKNRWTPAWYSGDPSTENPNARFPRLTYGSNPNNTQASSFWLADGSFLRWKSLDVSYRFNSNKCFSAIGLSNVVLQFVGQNLATFDSVKLWDPGQASQNGAVYPIQRTFSLQLTANF